MSRWRELARRLKQVEGEGDIRDDRDQMVLAPDIVPNVPFVPSSETYSALTSVLWQTALLDLDRSIPPQGFKASRWRQLFEDACWLAERHGDAASALGWTASDLFGVHETLDDWGGLADRLHGARRVHFTDVLAHWRTDEEEGWLWRKSLRTMPLIWELDHCPGETDFGTGAAPHKISEHKRV